MVFSQMKKSLLIVLVPVLTLLLIFASSPPKLLAAPVSESSPIQLKLNQYYVAYTAPRAPYLDENNRLMVPLRSIADLTHSQAAYNPATKSVTLKRKNSLKEAAPSAALQVTLGSQQAVVNGKTISMDTKPVLLRGSVFVPLGMVAQAFNLGLEWDRQQHVVTLREDPAYLPSGIVMDELYFFGQHTSTTLQPTRSKIEIYSEKGSGLARLHITAQNHASSQTKSQPYLHVYVQDSNFRSLDLTANPNQTPGANLGFDTKNTILANSLRYVLVEPCKS
ncbi:hypothetical protein B9G55_12680 [Saccharibacillus sp. O16]|nr:hypothetical protein B9G55_12680 [Saccharibacillus sp. O16]